MLALTLYFLAGFLAQRLGFLPAKTYQYLNKFILYVSLPALIFLKTRFIPISMQALIPILMPVISFLISFAVFYAWGKRSGWSRGQTGALILLGGLGNTSFIGFPLIVYFYGESYLAYGLMVDQGGSFITVSTLGLVLASVYSGNKVDYKEISKKVLLFPTTIAFFLALFFLKANYPVPLEQTLSFLGSLLGPIALISVGLQLDLGSIKQHWREVSATLILKMVLVPLIYLAIAAYFFDIKDPIIQITLFESAMPPMITAGIIAQEYGLATSLVPAVVGSGIIAGFGLLSAWYWILQLG